MFNQCCSIHNLLRKDVLANVAELQDTKQITFESCAAYGIIPQPTEDKSHEYEAIPLAHLPPARGSGPTSSPQMSVQCENTRALQDHRAVISGQARSTPQDEDEHLYEPTCAPASIDVPVTGEEH